MLGQHYRQHNAAGLWNCSLLSLDGTWHEKEPCDESSLGGKVSRTHALGSRKLPSNSGFVQGCPRDSVKLCNPWTSDLWSLRCICLWRAATHSVRDGLSSAHQGALSMVSTPCLPHPYPELIALMWRLYGSITERHSQGQWRGINKYKGSVTAMSPCLDATVSKGLSRHRDSILLQSYSQVFLSHNSLLLTIWSWDDYNLVLFGVGFCGRFFVNKIFGGLPQGLSRHRTHNLRV